VLRAKAQGFDRSPLTDLMPRFVITVEFVLRPSSLQRFLALIKDNAHRSLSEEPGCDRFDVLVQKGSAERVLLYEIYKDRAAFDFHLKSQHFQEFNATSAALVMEKKVVEYEYVNDREQP
jgi:quinol monooxygenase YgiN